MAKIRFVLLVGLSVLAITGCKTAYVPAPTGGYTSGASTFLSQVEGATLVAQDGTYLGKVTVNKYDTDSIINEYGTYGSKYAADSILNTYGSYGSPYAQYSAFNDYSEKPPEIVKDGSVLGYVTTNKTIANGVNPYALIGALHGQ
jgi:hypothetical protein